MHALLKTTLQKLLKAASRKHTALKDECRRCIAQLDAAAAAASSAAYKDNPTLKDNNNDNNNNNNNNNNNATSNEEFSGDEYFYAFKLACDTESAKLTTIALECVHQLVAVGQMRGLLLVASPYVGASSIKVSIAMSCAPRLPFPSCSRRPPLCNVPLSLSRLRSLPLPPGCFFTRVSRLSHLPHRAAQIQSHTMSTGQRCAGDAAQVVVSRRGRRRGFNVDDDDDARRGGVDKDKDGVDNCWTRRRQWLRDAGKGGDACAAVKDAAASAAARCRDARAHAHGRDR
jgi:hypothetical protein